MVSFEQPGPMVEKSTINTCKITNFVKEIGSMPKFTYPYYFIAILKIVLCLISDPMGLSSYIHSNLANIFDCPRVIYKELGAA